MNRQITEQSGRKSKKSAPTLDGGRTRYVISVLKLMFSSSVNKKKFTRKLPGGVYPAG